MSSYCILRPQAAVQKLRGQILDRTAAGLASISLCDDLSMLWSELNHESLFERFQRLGSSPSAQVPRGFLTATRGLGGVVQTSRRFKSDLSCERPCMTDCLPPILTFRLLSPLSIISLC